MCKPFWMFQVSSEEQYSLSAGNKALSHLNVSLIITVATKSKNPFLWSSSCMWWKLLFLGEIKFTV